MGEGDNTLRTQVRIRIFRPLLQVREAYAVGEPSSWEMGYIFSPAIRTRTCRERMSRETPPFLLRLAPEPTVCPGFLPDYIVKRRPTRRLISPTRHVRKHCSYIHFRKID